MSELKRCPWCGSDAVFPRQDGPLHFVHCSHCSVTGPTGVSEDHAIAAWNRRAHPEGEVREALEEDCLDLAERWRREDFPSARMTFKTVKALRDEVVRLRDNESVEYIGNGIWFRRDSRGDIHVTFKDPNEQ